MSVGSTITKVNCIGDDRVLISLLQIDVTQCRTGPSLSYGAARRGLGKSNRLHFQTLDSAGFELDVIEEIFVEACHCFRYDSGHVVPVLQSMFRMDNYVEDWVNLYAGKTRIFQLRLDVALEVSDR